MLRYDRVDYNRGVTGDDEHRGTVGLNWRPVPDAVLKSELQLSRLAPAGSEFFGDTSKRLVVSMATYF